MAQISLNNGNTYMTAEEAMEQINERSLWDVIVNQMDDEIREDVVYELDYNDYEDENLQFLREYLNRAETDLVIG